MAVIGAIVAAVAPYAAVGGAVAGTAIAAKSAGDQAKAQENAARDAQRLAEMNAIATERENDQQAANLAKEQGKAEATNRAKAAASGTTGQGSFGIVLEDQTLDNATQLNWLKGSGASQATIQREQGQSAYNVGMANASASKAQGAGAIVGGISDVYGISKSAGWLDS